MKSFLYDNAIEAIEQIQITYKISLLVDKISSHSNSYTSYSIQIKNQQRYYKQFVKNNIRFCLFFELLPHMVMKIGVTEQYSDHESIIEMFYENK